MSKNENRPAIPITKLAHDKAKEYLLKETSFSNFDLPTYFSFHQILSELDTFLVGKNLTGLSSATIKPRDVESVNYVILNNKDGQYAWRPMQLIHPVLYVDLVHKVTAELNWKVIVDRFTEFEQNSAIKCTSIPLKSDSPKVDKAEQILNWWHEIEQQSIEHALDFPVLCCTDIVDCYSAIYTHSISWAVHGKAIAKSNRRDMALIGNAIDTSLQDMSHGQTNGIPQGSVLMDLIAEMVLGYADLELTKRIDEAHISRDDFKILRYRDDYRIFTTGTRLAQEILRLLTTVLSDLGLKLNSSKTNCTSDVISGSIKPDKLRQLQLRSTDKDLQKHLLIIHQHAKSFPNSGSLAKGLSRFYRRINRLKVLRPRADVLVSIATDIAFHNPRCYPHVAAIISKLLSLMDAEGQVNMARRIQRKFEHLPNTGYMQIWLQRATIRLRDKVKFVDPLCNIVTGGTLPIWDSCWISSKGLINILDVQKIIDQASLANIDPVIPVKEVDVFNSVGSY